MNTQHQLDMVNEDLNNTIAALHQARESEPINLAALVDPEKEYPVSYYYHPQRGRVAPPESGMLEGQYLTAPQIKELYEQGLLG